MLLDVQRSLRRFPPGEQNASSGLHWSRPCNALRCFLCSALVSAVSDSQLLCLMNAGMPDEQREGLQEELIDIILWVLVRNPQLHYYQGYHDIVVTFLLVLGERLATALVEKLSTHHLRCASSRQPTWLRCVWTQDQNTDKKDLFIHLECLHI